VVGRFPTSCAIKCTSFKVKRSKIKVIRPINAEIKSVSYLTNRKPYELQSCYTDGAQRPVSLTRLKVKVARSLGPCDRCWPIIRERKVPETSKLVGRLITPRAITRSWFEVKRSKVKVTRPINAHTVNVQYLSKGKAFKLGTHRWSTKTGIADKRHDLQGQRSTLQGHVMRLTGAER